MFTSEITIAVYNKLSPTHKKNMFIDVEIYSQHVVE